MVNDTKPNEMMRDWTRFGTSVFTKMTMEAQRAGAINLAQGFPDFDGPELIKEAAIAAIRNGFNQYAPSAGLPALRERIAARYERSSKVQWCPDAEVTVFSGATEALYVAISSLLQPGDELIVFTPCYDSYAPAAYAAGATVRCVPLVPPDWKLSVDALENAINERTRMILVNSPHNPTGMVFSKEELQSMANLAQKHDLLVLTDEVYEELVYDDASHISMASLAGMKERTITVSSTSKTFSFTGWKVGYAVASSEITRILRAVHQFTVFCSATPLQHGMIAAFDMDDSYYEELRNHYNVKRKLLFDILIDIGFECKLSQGSYFVAAGLNGILSKQARRCSDMEFALELTRAAGVACVPFSAFYPDGAALANDLGGYVRFAFCKDENTLQMAGDKLAAYLSR